MSDSNIGVITKEKISLEEFIASIKSDTPLPGNQATIVTSSAPADKEAIRKIASFLKQSSSPATS